MNIIIKELDLELINDYLDFFDNRAFTDGNPNGPCYCTSSNMDRETERKMISEFGNDIKGTIRKYAVEMLSKGKIRGYLAFDGDESIGWCNAADIESYSSFIPEIARKNTCGKTYSIVCFEIAPKYRGIGIATKFINRICNDAKEKGYKAVEGYSKIEKDYTLFDYNGPISLYEKAGFSEVLRSEKQIIMRKIL